MIITKIKLRNWYSFKDCSLDLSYPRKIVDSNIPFEYLDAFENIRFKRVVILSGANATGKTSFAKILLAIRSFISSGELNRYFSEGINKNETSLGFMVEFIDQNPMPENIDCSNQDTDFKNYDFYHQLEVIVTKDNQVAPIPFFKFCYKAIEIKKTDSIESLRTLLSSIEDDSSSKKSRKTIYINSLNDSYGSKEYIEKLFAFKNLRLTKHWNFLYNDHSDDTVINSKVLLNKDILQAVLKTFDPSVENVEDAYQKNKPEEPNGFFVNFYNGNKIYISSEGAVNDEKHLLSLGTFESIKIANFISIVLSTQGRRGCTFFLDEGMSHVQSEIERTIVNLIIQKMNRYSQFFYTTHNYDVLDMNLPIHSYLFIRKDEEYNSYFIRPEETFKKNDRSIVNYIKNDVLRTLPNTTLLEDILMQD
ncbi:MULTISPECIES: AAA family ATPase [unclassified Acinetobacter]|uniref:AAA family ATPase n=1 Tax=unclassified Acinetobacter TaxID=196816 RepID=UPI0015D3BF50